MTNRYCNIVFNNMVKLTINLGILIVTNSEFRMIKPLKALLDRLKIYCRTAVRSVLSFCNGQSQGEEMGCEAKQSRTAAILGYGYRCCNHPQNRSHHPKNLLSFLLCRLFLEEQLWISCEDFLYFKWHYNKIPIITLWEERL